MADRNLMAQHEIDGMAAVPDTGREPWATRLQGPHPQHVSVAAGALMTVTSSRTHAYMLAYTLADAGLLVPVSGSDGEQDTAGPLSDDLVPKIERVITGYSSPPPARVLAWAVADLIRSHRSVPVTDCELQANSKPNQNLELADSDLRDRIAQYLHTAQCAGSDANPFDCRKADHWQDWRDLADITMAAVAPVLADRDTALEKAHINATRHARLAEAHRRQEEEVEQAKTELAKLAPFDKWESPPSLMDWVHMVRLELAARATQVDYMRWLHAEAMHHLGQAGDYIRVTRERGPGVCVECLCAGGIHKTWCKTGPVAGDTEPSEQAEPQPAVTRTEWLARYNEHYETSREHGASRRNAEIWAQDCTTNDLGPEPCERCGHAHDGSCSVDCLECPPCTSSYTDSGQTYQCALRGKHPESAHCSNVKKVEATWTDGLSDAEVSPATPPEPRPGDIVRVSYETTVRGNGLYFGHGAAWRNPEARNAKVEVLSRADVGEAGSGSASTAEEKRL